MVILLDEATIILTNPIHPCIVDSGPEADPRDFDGQQLAPRHQTLKRHEAVSWFRDGGCHDRRSPDRSFAASPALLPPLKAGPESA